MHGTVRGIPWMVQSFVTAPADEWWNAVRPIGRELEFLLGDHGEHGRALVNTWIPIGHLFTVTGISLRRLGDAVVWIAVISDEVSEVDVRSVDMMPEGRPAVELIQDNGLRFVCFFTPRDIDIQLEATISSDTAGEVVLLPRLGLPTGRVHAITLNPISWPEGQVPPGWPAEMRSFHRGAGPRWSEDLFLHASPFPLYVLPPEHWPGAPRGVTASRPWSIDRGQVVTDVTFSYLRGSGLNESLDVVSSNPNEVDYRDKAWQEHAWWFDHRLDQETLYEFPNGFPLDLSILHSGPAKYVGGGSIRVAETSAPIERWSFPQERELLLIRVRLPETWLSVRSLNISDRELLRICTLLRQLRADSDLLMRMKRAGFEVAS